MSGLGWATVEPGVGIGGSRSAGQTASDGGRDEHRSPRRSPVLLMGEESPYPRNGARRMIGFIYVAPEYCVVSCYGWLDMINTKGNRIHEFSDIVCGLLPVTICCKTHVCFEKFGRARERAKR